MNPDEAEEKEEELDEAARKITEAHGFAQLGLYGEARELLGGLSSAVRATWPAQAVRLIIYTGTGKWLPGARLAELFDQYSPGEEREAAGRFLTAYAAELRRTGREGEAAEALRRAAEIWPEGGVEAVKKKGRNSREKL